MHLNAMAIEALKGGWLGRQIGGAVFEEFSFEEGGRGRAEISQGWTEYGSSTMPDDLKHLCQLLVRYISHRRKQNRAIIKDIA